MYFLFPARRWIWPHEQPPSSGLIPLETPQKSLTFRFPRQLEEFTQGKSNARSRNQTTNIPSKELQIQPSLEQKNRKIPGVDNAEFTLRPEHIETDFQPLTLLTTKAPSFTPHPIDISQLPLGTEEDILTVDFNNAAQIIAPSVISGLQPQDGSFNQLFKVAEEHFDDLEEHLSVGQQKELNTPLPLLQQTNEQDKSGNTSENEVSSF